MKQEEDKFTGLPENAFRELKPAQSETLGDCVKILIFAS